MMNDTVETPPVADGGSALFCSFGSEETALTDDEIKSKLFSFLESMGPREDVLILPPDYTRFPSQGVKLTRFVTEYYNLIDTKKEDSLDRDDKGQKLDDDSSTAKKSKGLNAIDCTQ